MGNCYGKEEETGMNKKLFAYRNFSGVGDWIMAMTVLKMVNQQYPDIDIYINLKAKNRFAGVNYPIPLPELVQEVIKGFDVDVKGFRHYSNINGVNNYYDHCTGHMGYKKDGTNFIEGMVKQFNTNTGLLERPTRNDWTFIRFESKFNPYVDVDDWLTLEPTNDTVDIDGLITQISHNWQDKTAITLIAISPDGQPKAINPILI